MDFNISTASLIGDNSTDHNYVDFSDGNMGVPAVLLIIAILGVCGNGFIIYLYRSSKVQMDSSNKAVINLAFTDLLTMANLVFVCLLILFHVELSKYLCLSTVSILFYLISVTQLVLLVTTFDRYIVICQQERYSKLITKRFLNILLALAWVIPVPLSILPFFGFNHFNEIQSCFFRTMLHRWIYIAQSVFFIVVMVLTLMFYIPIIFKSVEFHKKSYPAKFHGINASTARYKAKRRAIRKSVFVGFLTIFFMCCNLPYSIVRFQFAKEYSGDDSTVNVTFLLGVVNSIFNPFLYALQKRAFRQQTKAIFKCRFTTKIHPNQAMPQTRSPLRNNELEIRNGKRSLEKSRSRVAWPSTSREIGNIAFGGKSTIKQNTLESNVDEGEILQMITLSQNKMQSANSQLQNKSADFISQAISDNLEDEISVLRQSTKNPSKSTVWSSFHGGSIQDGKLENTEDDINILDVKMSFEDQTVRSARPSSTRGPVSQDKPESFENYPSQMIDPTFIHAEPKEETKAKESNL